MLNVLEPQALFSCRCKLLCCCMGSDEQSTDAFSGVAQLFSNFFGVKYYSVYAYCRANQE